MARPAQPSGSNAGTPPNLSQGLAAAVDQAVLAALSEPDLNRLASLLEPPLSPHTAARSADLLQSALAATAAGNVAEALDAISHFAALQPLRAQTLSSTPGLESIGPQVDALLARVSQLARVDAEGRLARATQLIEEAATPQISGWDARPETLLLLATRLLASGTHANFTHAAELAQVVIEGARWAPVPVPPAGAEGMARRASLDESGVTQPRPIRAAFQRSWKASRQQAPRRLRALWARAPLLVLLLGWLTAGIAAGLFSWAWHSVAPDSWPAASVSASVGIWAVGFLALVLFGFYMRVRNVRF